VLPATCKILTRHRRRKKELNIKAKRSNVKTFYLLKSTLIMYNTTYYMIKYQWQIIINDAFDTNTKVDFKG
jgi:hypothetical protein